MFREQTPKLPTPLPTPGEVPGVGPLCEVATGEGTGCATGAGPQEPAGRRTRGKAADRQSERDRRTGAGSALRSHPSTHPAGRVAAARRRFYGDACELCLREPRAYACGGVRIGESCYRRVLAVALTAGQTRHAVTARVSRLAARGVA